MGLTVSKKIVDNLKGSISVNKEESMELGTATLTTLQFTIKMADVQLEP